MDWHRYNVTLQFRYVQVRIKPIVTLYRIAFVPAQKPYWIRLLFTHEKGDFGVFSVMERSCAARISKVESHISDRCSYYTGELFVSARKVYYILYRMNIALIVETLRLIRLLYTHTHKWTTEIASGKRMETGLRWCYTGRFATTIFSATQRCNVTTMF